MAKIIVVVTELDLGGVTTSAINFCNEMAKRGNEVTLLNMNKGEAYPQRLCGEVEKAELSGMPVLWNLDAARLRAASLPQKLWLVLIAVFKKILNRCNKWYNVAFFRYQVAGQYDIAIAFRQCNPCYYFTLNCIQAKSKVAFIHGHYESVGKISTFDRFFEKFDVVNCVSKACCAEFKQHYPEIEDKFSVVYNMFPVEEIENLSLEEATVSINRNRFTIVTVSRIENVSKGTERIAEICVQLEKLGFEFTWYVLGDGPDFKENVRFVQENGLEDRLVYCGAVSNPHAIVRKCDLSVLPTRGEAYSMTVIESQIVGTPIVVARYDGVEEAVQHGISGLIAEQSVESLSEMIAACIQNRGRILDTMRLNLQKMHFDNENAYRQFMQTIDAVE